MKNKTTTVDVKVLFHLSWITSAYILFLMIQSKVASSEWIIVGVIRELITIPLFLSQVVIFFLAIFYCIKYGIRQNPYFIWIILIPLVNILIAVLPVFTGGPVNSVQP